MNIMQFFRRIVCPTCEDCEEVKANVDEAKSLTEEILEYFGKSS